MRRLTIILLLLAGPVSADKPEMPGDHQVELTVKPVLCITDRRSPTCEMSFLVYWQSQSKGYYCVFNDFETAPLRCWEDDDEGRMTDDRDVSEDFEFWVTDKEHSVPLAVVAVEVLRMDSDDRRRRRRVRHVCDIN